MYKLKSQLKSKTHVHVMFELTSKLRKPHVCTQFGGNF